MTCPYMTKAEQLIQDIKNLPLFIQALPVVLKEEIDKVLAKYGNEKQTESMQGKSQTENAHTEQKQAKSETIAPSKTENVVQDIHQGQDGRDKTTDQLRNQSEETKQETKETAESDQKTAENPATLEVVFYENGVEVKRGSVIKDRFEAWKSKV